MHRKFIHNHRGYWSNPVFQRSVLFSVLFFTASIVVSFYAIHFAGEHASNYVTDVILSNTPVFAVEDFFVYGTFVMIAISSVIATYHPKQIPFVLNTVALFFIIRSGFTSLTHLAPYPVHATSDFGTAINRAFFGSDRFFSAHTGLPFLGALGFWYKPAIRYLFLATSVYFGVVVLMGHLHYSIDVLSAFFITYTIYHIARWLFATDYARFIAKDPA